MTQHSCGWRQGSWQCAGSHADDKVPPSLREPSTVLDTVKPKNVSRETLRKVSQTTEQVAESSATPSKMTAAELMKLLVPAVKPRRKRGLRGQFA